MSGQAMLMSIGGSLGLRPRLAFANRVHILSCRQCRTQLLCGSSGVTRQEQCALYLLLVSYHAAVANCVLIFYSTLITPFPLSSPSATYRSTPGSSLDGYRTSRPGWT